MTLYSVGMADGVGGVLGEGDCVPWEVGEGVAVPCGALGVVSAVAEECGERVGSTVKESVLREVVEGQGEGVEGAVGESAALGMDSGVTVREASAEAEAAEVGEEVLVAGALALLVWLEAALLVEWEEKVGEAV